jgi:hypothetical protein
MALFVVSYDLMKEPDSDDYKPLWDKFKRLDAVKAQYSVYLVSYDGKIGALYNELVALIDGNDRLLVVPFTDQPLYKNAIAGTKAWLTAHGLP